MHGNIFGPAKYDRLADRPRGRVAVIILGLVILVLLGLLLLGKPSRCDGALLTYVDSETGVEYVVPADGRCGISVRYHADGSVYVRDDDAS